MGPIARATIGSMKVRELLIETVAHIAPGRALEGLASQDAERHVPGVNHSIAEILERAVALGEQDGRLDDPIAPAIEFPPLAHYSIRDALVHMANHNSHHLGQVILLRQVMGLWPPPSGSWTW